MQSSHSCQAQSVCCPIIALSIIVLQTPMTPVQAPYDSKNKSLQEISISTPRHSKPIPTRAAPDSQSRPQFVHPLNSQSLPQPSPMASQKPILIGVMGLTGVGKSNFIQTITGDENIKIGKRLKSCTQEVRSAALIDIDGHSVQLVDTPGFSDTKLTDTDVLGMIADWMKKSFDDNQKLHGIVLLHCIADTRMHAGSTRCVRLFGDICGKDFLKNTVMVTTMWDKRCRDPEDLEESQEAEVDLLSEHWAQHLKVDKGAGGAPEVKMIGRTEAVRLAENVKSDGSAMYARSYNNKKNCEDIIRQIVVQTQNIPELQKEVGEQKKGLGDTAAGAGLKSALDELAKEHTKKMRELEERYQKSMEANETKITKLLEEERAFQREQMAKNQKDRDALARTTAEMQKEHKELLARMVKEAGEREKAEKERLKLERIDRERMQREHRTMLDEGKRKLDELERRREHEALERHGQEEAERRQMMEAFNKQRKAQVEEELEKKIKAEFERAQLQKEKERKQMERERQWQRERERQRQIDREWHWKIEREKEWQERKRQKQMEEEKRQETLREHPKKGMFLGRILGAVGYTYRNVDEVFAEELDNNGNISGAVELEGQALDVHSPSGVFTEEPHNNNVILRLVELE